MSAGSETSLGAARRDGLAAAQRFRLPFGGQRWRGAAGGWQGSGEGSSIDFHDHRAYAPGDDPRHLHWAAYARTGQLTMKLYRAEVAPRVDLLVDASASMRAEPARAARTESLVAFCLASAARAGAPVRIQAVAGRRCLPLAEEQVRAEGFWAAAGEPETGTGAVAPEGLQGRTGAMKIWISDLLYPGEPGAVLRGLAAGGGCVLVLAPVLAGEAELRERGNMELVDREGGAARHLRIDDGMAERYQAAYFRHFNLWRETARRMAVGWARVDSNGALASALAGEARQAGVVEVVA
ncbi:MAG: DUF58 domain-containing protein [Verrucomicrobia bacterium]|nr:DUF58 domain-containing protein [Verrucomicrobiota bacterium]